VQNRWHVTPSFPSAGLPTPEKILRDGPEYWQNRQLFPVASLFLGKFRQTGEREATIRPDITD